MTQYKTLWYVVLLFSLALAILTIPNRIIFIDDHWFAEQAYWLVQDGVVRSELFRGLLNYQIEQFAYHKLHIWQAALVIKYFGLSPYALKTVELIFFIIFIAFLYIYFRNNYPAHQVQILFIITITLIIANGTLVEQIFYYRPETALMLFGFLSFSLLRSALRKIDNDITKAIFAGALAGITVLYHLNGLVYIVAGACLLAVSKKYRLLPPYLIASLCIAGIYFIDIRDTHAVNQFLMQFKHDPALSHSTLGVWQYPLNILLEVKHMFRHTKEGAFHLFLIVTVTTNWKAIKNNQEIRLVFIYFIIVLLVLAAISPGKRDPNYYSLLYMPYAAIVMGFCLMSLHTQRIVKLVPITFLLVSYLITNYVHSADVIQEEKSTPKTNRKMFSVLGIENGKSVAGPVTLVFNEIQNVKLYAVRTYFMKVKDGVCSLSIDSFFKDMFQNNIDYILLPQGYSDELNLIHPENINNLYGYSYYRDYVDVDTKYYIFIRQR